MPPLPSTFRANRARPAGSWDRLQVMATDAGTMFVARIVAIVLVVGLLAGGAVLGVRSLRGVLFHKNPKFTLRTLHITSGNTVSAEAVRQVTGIREGMNLFLFNLPRIRRDFLRNLPNVREIRMERHLPDTLQVSVFERIPVAKLSRNGRVVTDFDGYIFSIQAGQETLADTLPVLASEEWANLQPGQRMGARPRQALAVLDTAESLRLAFRIVEIDTTNPHYLLLHTAARQEVGLPWESLAERHTIVSMLGEVGLAMASPRAVSANRFDVSPEDGRVYARYQ